MQPVASPLQGTIVSIDVGEGDAVRAGQQLVVLESMKMEHVVAADCAGTVNGIAVIIGQTVMPGDALMMVEPGDGAADTGEAASATVDLDHERADLAEVIVRHDVGLDHRRPDAVARRRASGQRTARENIT